MYRKHTVKKLIWLAVAIAALALSAKYLPFRCATCQAPNLPHIDIYGYNTEAAKIGSTALTLEIADTDAARELGLSKRDYMPDNTGMLFVFQRPGTYGFWMKDMKFALDIIWIDPNNRVIAINKDVTPSTYNSVSPEIFYPPAPVGYVVEVPAGFSDAHGIDVGENFSIGQ